MQREILTFFSRLVEAFLSETDYNFEKLIVDGGVARYKRTRKDVSINILSGTISSYRPLPT